MPDDFFDVPGLGGILALPPVFAFQSTEYRGGRCAAAHPFGLGIMTNRFTRKLSFGKRILLATAAVLVIAGPIVVGLLNPQRGRAQSQTGVAAALASEGVHSPEEAGQATQPVPSPRGTVSERAAQNADTPAMQTGQPPNARPKFEVASVKRTDRCFAGNNVIDPESVILKGLPLKAVLREAFKVPMDRIEGPSWLDTDCFEISAKIPEGATSDQLPAMYQALLTERFRLAAHKEDRPRPGYALVVDKGGPKFKEDDPNTNFMGAGRSGMVMFGAFGHGAVKGVRTMAALAANLSTEGYGPVQDLTGLTGKYDIDLSWTRDPDFAPRDPAASAATPPVADTPAASGADLFAALRDQLGLRLERRQMQVQFLVIDHVERVPTEN